MQLVVLGVNHRTAPVAVRENLAFSAEEVKQSLKSVYEYEELSECVILSTCNRTEIYAVLEDVNNTRDFMLNIMKKLKKEIDIPKECFYFYEGRNFMEHLFRVSASLDSLVIGEGQILSQLKVAYITAYSAGLTGPVFNIIFQKAISVGKKVRTHTDIANSPVSVSYTAVNLAEDCLDKSLSDAKALILGAGQMSELTATHLQAKGVKTIFVSNRTYQRAEVLAQKFGGQAIQLDNFIEKAKEADIIITSTGAPHYIIKVKHAKEIAAARKNKPVVIIDIALPRDVDPEVGYVEGINLFNIDALESVVEENKQHRLEEAEKAKPIIATAITEIEEKLSYLSVRPMMTLLTDKAEQIRRRELHRAMAKLPKATEQERKIMDTMSRMIVRKLLRNPMIRFGEVAGKDEEGPYWDLFRDMFDLEKETRSL